MSVGEYYAQHAHEGRAFLPRPASGYRPVLWITRDKHCFTLCSSMGSLKVLPAGLSIDLLLVVPKRPMHRSYVSLHS